MDDTPTGEPAPRYLRLRAIFEAALALPADARDAFVRREAAGDDELAAECLQMLRAPEVASTALAAGARSAIATADALPRQIGPYRIVGLLGRGGMGVVYRAVRADLTQHVAIKVSQRPFGLSGDEILARFELERRALSAMSHRCIARIFDAGTTEHGEPYFVMELVAGKPLTRYCDEQRLPVAKRLQLFRQVCEGVQHAHSRFIVHRDLKPDNVLVVDEDGTPVPKILDFGLAKATDADRLATPLGLTGEDRRLGTLLYMSPEQADGRSDEVDARSDVYALGVMLYELLAGELPFAAAELERLQREQGRLEVIARLIHQEPDQPSVRFAKLPGNADVAARREASASSLRRNLVGDLDQIVMKALAKEPERRYGSATELAADLQRHLEHLPVLAGPPSASYRLKKLVRRYRGPLLAASLVVIASLTFGSLALRQYWRAQASEGGLALRAGKLAFRNAQWEQAIAAQERALATGAADEVEVLCDRVECLEALGKVSESVALLRSLPAGRSPATEARRLLLLGTSGADRSTDPDSGLPLIRQALQMRTAAGTPELGPGDVAVAEAMTAQDLDSMIRALSTGLESDPTHRMANELLPPLLMFAGRVDDTIKQCEVCLARWPSDPQASSLLAFASAFAVESAVGQRASIAALPAPYDGLATLLRETVVTLRGLFDRKIEQQWQEQFGTPPSVKDTAREFFTITGLVMRLAPTLAGFAGETRVDWIGDRLPPAVLRTWRPVLQYFEGGTAVAQVTRMLRNPAELHRILGSLDPEFADSGLLMLRAIARLAQPFDSPAAERDMLEAIEADLAWATQFRGPLGCLPEVRRMIAMLRMRATDKLMHFAKDEPTKLAELRARCVEIGKQVLEMCSRGPAANGTGVQAGEALVHAVKVGRDAGDRALAQQILHRAHDQHPEDAQLMISLAENAIAMSRPAEAMRWLRLLLLDQPDHAGARSMLEKLEAAPTPADAAAPKK